MITTKPAWLQEVEDDAVRITQKRFRDQEEERQYNLKKSSTGSKPVREDAVEDEEAKRGPGRPKKEEV